jgi:hypothetical protein
MSTRDQLIAYLATLAALCFVFGAALFSAGHEVTVNEAFGLGTITGGLIGVLRIPSSRTVTVDNPPEMPVQTEEPDHDRGNCTSSEALEADRWRHRTCYPHNHASERPQRRSALEKLASQEKAAHAGTVANYRSASEEAARLDALNVIRVRREQSAITERVVHDYQNRIISADARYDRLRDQAKAYSSGGSDPAVSDAREATCRAYAATGCDELPAKLKAAQDNTDKLIALQAWASAQAAVEVSELPH